MTSQKGISALSMIGSVAFALLLAACQFNPQPMDDLQEPPRAGQDSISFQEYFWLENPAALLIQVGIVLAGAFGVAALLPSPEEEKSDE